MLPEGWAWARLRKLFNVCSSKRVLQSDWKKEGVPFYRAREIAKLSDNGFVDNELFISEEYFLSLSRDYGVPQPGDLMVSGVGTIGKIYIVKPSDHFYYKDASVLCFENRHNVVISEFARILLESNFVQHQMKNNSKGTTVDTITISAATNYLCIIPPINEQIRIIDIVENALVYVDTVCKNKKSLHATLSTAKSKILDLAIRGKLVPQDPNDEPASVLLERIRAEKEELIKQGKIKRNKKESVIFKGDDNSYYEKIGENVRCINEEIPFDLPSNSLFVRFKDVWGLLSGRDLAPGDYNDNEQGVPYITGASNFDNGKVEVTRWTHCPQVVTKTGDLLITCKGTVGEMAFNTFGDSHIARQIMAVRNIYNLNIKYLSLCINFYIEILKAAAKGLIPGISREDILNLILPFPSERYQLSVVSRVNELFEIIDSIKKSLS